MSLNIILVMKYLSVSDKFFRLAQDYDALA